MGYGLDFSRRSSSASTASRMNCARLPAPQSRSTRAMTASDKRTCVALMPSAGLPMRDGVSDTAICDKPIPPIDLLSDTGFISGITYGNKPMFAYKSPSEQRAIARKTLKGHVGKAHHAVRYSCECGWESMTYWGSGMTGQAAGEFVRHKMQCLESGE